jgi:hypothetical protein
MMDELDIKKEIEISTEALRTLNDTLRRKLCSYEISSGETVHTVMEGVNWNGSAQLIFGKSVFSKSLQDQQAILRLVGGFDVFNEDNDPYGEHDSALFKYNGEDFRWKWDYYDKEMEFFGHECHVLTIYGEMEA